MQKIVINSRTNKVSQIICLDIDPTFDSEWYPNCYVVDDPDNAIKTHDLVYDPANGTYTKVVVTDEPKVTIKNQLSETELLRQEMSLALAEVIEEKDNQILELQLLIAELMEGAL